MAENKGFPISTDELTGLLDKQTFYECAQDVINNAEDGQEYAFVFFDLENFKIFNVNYGFELGDELLISIGYIIKDVFENQLVARFSGDHFVVCVNSLQVISSIKNIRDRTKLINKYANIEMKAGIYLYDGKEKDVVKCCDRARMACISIKKKYDVEYRVYDNELGGTIQRKQKILDSLSEALEKKYIKVYYQPVIRGITGEICGWEALVRWVDPVNGMVYPNEFIPVLEEYRLISKIDMFVIDEVLRRYHTDVEGRRPAVPVSINLSRIDFETMDLISFLEQKIQQYNCPKNMFHMEITESALIENPQNIMEQVTKLRANGFEVWMDDFGSGYSSLNLLKNYEFDLVKIDMAFLRDFDDEENGRIILKHIVSMIKNLGVHTLIEGVETREQLEFMKSIGCEMMQGYLFGRPMPYLEGIECIEKDGRKFESIENKLFYSELGTIDILRQNPLQNIENKGDEISLPLTIAEYEDEKWKLIYTNSDFVDVMVLLGYSGLEEVSHMLNEEQTRWLQYHHFMDICQQSKKDKKSQSMDYLSNGRIVNLRVRYVNESTSGGKQAYIISLRLLSRFVNSNYDKRLNEISRSMFSHYECVDLYGLDSDYYENIYLNDSRLHITITKKKPVEIIAEIRDTMVHVDDRIFFDKFFDFQSLRARIAEEPSGSIIGFFRVLDVRRNYVWKMVHISLMHFENEDAAICCVGVAPNEIARRMTGSQSERKNIIGKTFYEDVMNTPTSESILQLIPVGVFWKDRHRRFLGANQMFLDYYGFQSVEEIIGKTDEDMGWHINPEGFMKDELDVINNGKSIENVPGECIVKGKVRKIVASKRPYVVNREIIGLIGYFRDITEDLKQQEKLELLIMTDALTGLYNRRAFTEIVEKFMQQYQADNTDFAIIMMDIDKFKQTNDIYGHDFGDLVLTKTSQVLKNAAAESSVVFRFGGDEFIILHQHKNGAELESIIQEINAGLNRITQISNVQINIRLSIGVAIYSEFGNLRDCLDAADKEMYAEKEQHKKET